MTIYFLHLYTIGINKYTYSRDTYHMLFHMIDSVNLRSFKIIIMFKWDKSLVPNEISITRGICIHNLNMIKYRRHALDRISLYLAIRTASLAITEIVNEWCSTTATNDSTIDWCTWRFWRLCTWSHYFDNNLTIWWIFSFSIIDLRAYEIIELLCMHWCWLLQFLKISDHSRFFFKSYSHLNSTNSILLAAWNYKLFEGLSWLANSELRWIVNSNMDSRLEKFHLVLLGGKMLRLLRLGHCTLVV